MQDRQDDMELIKEWDRQAALRAEAERLALQKLPNKVSQTARFMPKKPWQQITGASMVPDLSEPIENLRGLKLAKIQTCNPDGDWITSLVLQLNDGQ